MPARRKSNFDEYYRLVAKIDKKVDKLIHQHSKNLQCKKGCDLCCMDYNIFPVEFYSILESFKKDKSPIKSNIKNSNTCAFLKDHVCTIYDYRPIICRTHGMPLIYMNNDNEWELSNCELNFKDYDFEKFTFDNTIQQDKFNSELYMINKKFIDDFETVSYDETELIPLKTLANYIK